MIDHPTCVAGCANERNAAYTADGRRAYRALERYSPPLACKNLALLTVSRAVTRMSRSSHIKVGAFL
ncbi:hypothetical protein KCP73_20770 [Salmonella enterica subsp. enterica]|nr:hypothetical protein KCP73_20770 [Salmonella enterica subsp. enterica]